MSNKTSQCEQFESMISEWIDGELGAHDSLTLQKHLNACNGCRQTAGSFEQVNTAVVNLSASAKHNSPSIVFASKPKPETSSRHRSFLRRLIAVAVAAAVLVGLFFAFPPLTTPVTANDFSPQKIAKPLKELHVLNMHQQRSQSLMLKTLSMDLRAMKLELNQIKDSQEQGELQQEIDLMLAKVQQFDSL